MSFDTTGPASLSALHLALAVIRRHRSASGSILSPFTLPSFLLAATPWLWPAPAALAAGAGLHAVWLLLCERLAPRPRVSAPIPAAAPVSAGTAAGSTSPAAVPARPPAGFSPLAVLAVIDEAPGIRTFRLRRPQGFVFTAGQFVPVQVRIDGQPHVRCYSISSPPHVDGYFEISVRRQGLVSGTLHGTLRAGATLAVGAPAGQFTYPLDDDRPLALIAGGIGITPLLAMTQHAVASDPSRPVTLLYSVRFAADVAFASTLQLLADRHPNVRVVVTLSDETGPSDYRTGRIDAAMLGRHVPEAAGTLFYLCGPPPMIDAISTLLRSIGVPDPQIRFERFALSAAAPLINASLQEESATAVVTASGHDSVQVTFATSGRTITAPRTRTLLESAEVEGVAITSACRSGVCLSCRTRLRSGTADCRSTVLDAADRAGGFILPCVSYPSSDCVLEA